jgi:Grx4 family monothiol glutaredoxin
MSGNTNTIIEFTDASVPPKEGTKCVILFYAEWHEACTIGGPMDQVLSALASSTASSLVQFGRCNVDDNPALVEKYQIEAVPTFLLLQNRDTVVTRLVGGEDVAAITAAVQRLVAASTHNTTTNQPIVDEATRLHQRLEQLIRHAPVMVFMKGTPEHPRCGFSRQVVELLQSEHIAFGAFDILTDEAVRQGLKTYSDWPTYPQVYVRGELIGGLDILKEMKADGGSSLMKQLGLVEETHATPTPIENVPVTPTPVTLEERLKALIHRSPVMLFMKGVPSAPKCGFSRQMVELLERAGVAYDAMDILSDEEVRQGLKEYSDWPTYPQLYVNGELLGGLDIVKEMEQDGSLKDLFQKM